MKRNSTIGLHNFYSLNNSYTFPLIISERFFFWYLQRGVILTKDNLVRKNWKGSLKCCFYNCNESITHLLFDCHHAKEIWRIVYLATGLTPPRSVFHMLGNWLSNFSDKERRVMLVGAAALYWAIWRCRNDIIFNKTKYSPFIQAIFRGDLLVAPMGAPTA